MGIFTFRTEGIGKNVWNGQTERIPHIDAGYGNPKLYKGTARGEVCSYQKQKIKRSGRTRLVRQLLTFIKQIV